MPALLTSPGEFPANCLGYFLAFTFLSLGYLFSPLETMQNERSADRNLNLFYRQEKHPLHSSDKVVIFRLYRPGKEAYSN